MLILIYSLQLQANRVSHGGLFNIKLCVKVEMPESTT
jgi:hypothetical protein